MLKIPLWLKVKAATADSVADAGGNKVCAAASSRIDRHATFSDYANDAEIKRVIPLDTAIEIDAFNMRAGKPPRLIALAAAELGLFLAQAPRVEADRGDVVSLCAITRESAEAIAHFSEALSDGDISPDEARVLRRDLADAIAAFAAADARLKLIEGGGA